MTGKFDKDPDPDLDPQCFGSLDPIVNEHISFHPGNTQYKMQQLIQASL